MNKTARQIFAFSTVSLVALVSIVAGTATVHAQGQGGGQGRQGGGFGGRQGGGGFGGRQGGFGGRQSLVATALTSITLTDAQKDQVKDINQKYRDQRRELMPQRGQGGGQGNGGDGGNGGGRPQITPELRTKITELETKEADEVKAILTDDQKTKFQTAYDAAKKDRDNGGLISGLSTALKLTDDQKTKITPILTTTGEAMKKIREDDSLQGQDKQQKMMAIWNDAKTKIRPILTPDQQKTLDEMRGIRAGGQRGQGGGQRGQGGQGGGRRAGGFGGGAGA